MRYIASTSCYTSLTRGRAAASGLYVVVGWFVCLFVICELTYLDATALRLYIVTNVWPQVSLHYHHKHVYTAWIAFTQQVISFKSARFLC